MRPERCFECGLVGAVQPAPISSKSPPQSDKSTFLYSPIFFEKILDSMVRSPGYGYLVNSTGGFATNAQPPATCGDPSGMKSGPVLAYLNAYGPLAWADIGRPFGAMVSDPRKVFRVS